jgi:hypothetical protein
MCWSLFAPEYWYSFTTEDWHNFAIEPQYGNIIYLNFYFGITSLTTHNINYDFDIIATTSSICNITSLINTTNTLNLYICPISFNSFDLI